MKAKNSVNVLIRDEKPQKISRQSTYKYKKSEDIDKDPSDLDISIDIEPDVVKAAMNCEEEDTFYDEIEYEPFSLSEYKSFIIDNLQSSEKIYKVEDTGLSCRQKYRTALIDWLINVHQEFEFEKDTLYLAISLFDRICMARKIKRCHYQLFAATALWISSKLSETVTPCVSDFIYLCDGVYKEKEFNDCERAFCMSLNFNFVAPQPLDYILPVSAKAEFKEIFDVAEFFLKVALYSELYPTTSPSVVAASVLYVAVSFTRSSNDCFYELDNFRVYKSDVDKFTTNLLETYKFMAQNGSKYQRDLIREGNEILPVA